MIRPNMKLGNRFAPYLASRCCLVPLAVSMNHLKLVAVFIAWPHGVYAERAEARACAQQTHCILPSLGEPLLARLFGRGSRGVRPLPFVRRV